MIVELMRKLISNVKIEKVVMDEETGKYKNIKTITFDPIVIIILICELTSLNIMICMYGFKLSYNNY